MESKTTRRSSFKKIGMGLAAVFGVGSVRAAATALEDKPKKPTKEVIDVIKDENGVPLFSSAVKHGNTLYVAGLGAHVEPFEIKAHVKIVLDNMKKILEENGSSMEQVLKVNVYLADLHDYKELNEAYIGAFGEHPPVRTTVSTYGGVPGDSMVEMDCIAALD